MQTLTIPHLAIGLLGLTLTAYADNEAFEMNINADQSNYVWSGSSNLGPLIGNPNFQLDGALRLELLNSDAAALGSGQILGSAAVIMPDIVAQLALSGGQINISNVVLRLDSPDFQIFQTRPTPTFATNVDIVIVSGTMAILPPTGPGLLFDLAGTSLGTVPTLGTIQALDLGIRIAFPLNFTINFDSPTWSGQIASVGSVSASVSCPEPTNYCPITPNATGPGSMISAVGSTSVFENDLSLRAQGVPPGVFGIFYYGPTAIQIPFGNGFRCVGGMTQRLPVQAADLSGNAFRELDFNGEPSEGGLVDIGNTWYFQFWHRDPDPDGAGFNLSNALRIFFCP